MCAPPHHVSTTVPRALLHRSDIRSINVNADTAAAPLIAGTRRATIQHRRSVLETLTELRLKAWDVSADAAQQLTVATAHLRVLHLGPWCDHSFVVGFSPCQFLLRELLACMAAAVLCIADRPLLRAGLK